MACNYNGIEFTDINTDNHVMGPATDPSHSDQLFTEFNLTIRSILNVKNLPAIVQDADAQTILARVRHYLTEPRGTLYYDITSPPGTRGPNPVFNLTDGRDDAGGPWPDKDAFKIAYTTPGTLEVIWKCTIRLRDCGSLNPSEPLSLRWEDSISWDGTWKATYHRSGTLIISSRSANNIDWFRRNKVAPAVCAGFQRMNATYRCSRDGLRCDFDFADEQIRFAPPYPGVELKINQSESAPLVGGMRKGNVSVSMTGIQSANVVDMGRWCLQIMKARIWSANPLTSQGTVLGTANLETIETTKGVESVATCSYKVQPDGTREGVLVAAFGKWAQSAADQAAGVVKGQTTPEGRLATGLTYFPWVGYGTSAKTQQNPGGFAEWANPTAAVGGPASGVGLAASISLFAALLNDPCGVSLSATPNAGGYTNELRTKPETFNDPTSGQGGPNSIQTSQLNASRSALNAAQYPVTLANTDKSGLTVWDGQAGVYDYWQSVNEYVDEPGVLVLPTSNPLGKNIAVNYASPQMKLIKRWTAKRQGATPALPPKQMQDPNFVYVGGTTPQLRCIDVGANGVDIIYEVSGVYVYEALDATIVPFIADIPPMLDQFGLRQAQQWANTVTLHGQPGNWLFVSNAALNAAPGASGGIGPLGNGALTFPVPN